MTFKGSVYAPGPGMSASWFCSSLCAPLSCHRNDSMDTALVWRCFALPVGITWSTTGSAKSLVSVTSFCLCVYTHVWRCHCMVLCGGQRTTSGIGPHLPSDLRRGLFVVSLLCTLGILVYFQGFSHLCLPSPHASCYMDPRNLNSGPHGFSARVFTHWLSTQACLFVSTWQQALCW